MAYLKINPATSSNYALDQTIVFLRPTTKEAILGVNATENDYCRFEVAPLVEPTSPLVEGTLDEEFKKISEVTPQAILQSKPPLTFTLLLSGLDLIQLRIHLEMDLQLGVQGVTSIF